MNKSILLTIIFVITAVGITSAYAVVSTTVTGDLDVTGSITGPTISAITTSLSSASVCSPENIQHWDKITFLGTLQIQNSMGQLPTVIDSTGAFIYDIKVLDDPTKVADLNQKVVDFLNPLGYGKTMQTPGDLTPMDVFVVEVDYSIVCTVPP